MPAEWEPHERCLIAWPTRRELWGHHLDAARAEHAAVAVAVAAFEPVTVVAAPGDADSARAECPADVDVIELAIDDSWLRDSGPLGIVDDCGNRRAVDFEFNAWGERWHPFDDDRQISRRLLERLGIERVESPMVLEGGSITVDGQGTAITTEQCLLHPNRNPEWSRADIEAELARTLGVSRVIWLPWGFAEDDETDGHVDGVCTFAAPGVVVAHGVPDTTEFPGNPNADLMRANLDVLRSAVDATGAPFEVIEIPHISYFDVDDAPYRTSAMNFYVANGGVVVPVADGDGSERDRIVLDVISAAFPDREVVGVRSRLLAFGGGGVHCITQQVPAAGA
jgi:agmatine deiminase